MLETDYQFNKKLLWTEPTIGNELLHMIKLCAGVEQGEENRLDIFFS